MNERTLCGLASMHKSRPSGQHHLQHAHTRFSSPVQSPLLVLSCSLAHAKFAPTRLCTLTTQSHPHEFKQGRKEKTQRHGEAQAWGECNKDLSARMRSMRGLFPQAWLTGTPSQSSLSTRTPLNTCPCIPTKPAAGRYFTPHEAAHCHLRPRTHARPLRRRPPNRRASQYCRKAVSVPAAQAQARGLCQHASARLPGPMAAICKPCRLTLA